MKYKTLSRCILASSMLTAVQAMADHPISGPSIYQKKIETALVWVEPVTMSPNPTTPVGSHYDIHNEVDQHAIKGDKMGFGAGGWLPDCEVACVIWKDKSSWKTVFSMMSMVANDGPHYGRNIKLDGPGLYYETCQIDPPDWRGFYRHTDKETGVGPFFDPYQIKGSFKFMGSGKAGGY